MKEKLERKPLILMIIGVITLTLTVVGATYAFFTASNSATGSTSVSATTENLGSVTVSNPTTNMHIRLKAVNMSEQAGGTSYYATTTSSDYVESVEYNSVANIKVSGGEDNTTYTCTYDLTISGSDVLEENDAKVIFKTESITNVSNLSIDGITPEEEIDLKTGANTYEVSFDVTGNMNETEMIKAGFKLNNLETEQDHLKNKTLTFSVENSNLKCSVKVPSKYLSTRVMELEGNGQVFNEGEAGYRYEGATVNNYVTFNNETWRIIGVEEGSKIGLTSGEYYTKIIREHVYSTDRTLFSLPYDSDNDHEYDWTTTSLYTIFNGDYYNRSGDYASAGLTSESKELIVDANWYYTPINVYSSYTSSDYYAAERNDATKVVKDAIGLMSPSDFGYAATQSECSSVALNSYNSSNYLCNEKDWLHNGNSNQWTIIPYSSNASFALQVNASGRMSDYSANSGCVVRPVVYLDSNVVITNDGDGSVGNKFELGK